MTQPTRAEVRSRNNRFKQMKQPFSTNRWSDPVSDPIPFNPPPSASGLPDQDILDEFWRRGLLSRFAVDTLMAELKTRGYKVDARMIAPKYVPEVRNLLTRYYAAGQGFSPSALAAFAFKHGIQSRTGTVPNLNDAIAHLVERGEVIKHSGTHYEFVAPKGS